MNARSPRRPLPALLLALIATAPAPALAQEAARPTTLVRVDASLPGARAKLMLLPHADVFCCGHDPDSGYLQALVRPADLPRLRSLGLRPEVVHDDVEKYWASRLVATPADRRALRPTGGTGSALVRGSMGGYLTWTEILAKLDSWRALYPNLITARQSIGQSHEGRDQWIVKISANADVDESEPEIYVQSLIHAREPAGMMSFMWVVEHLLSNYGVDPAITDLMDNREIWYVPVMNVDGFEYNRRTNPNGGGSWRKNRRPVGGGNIGVDLNRNFGFNWGFDNRGSSPTPSSGTYRGTGPFSEVEARNVRDFINSRLKKGMTMAWDVHTAAGMCMFPWGYANRNTPQHAQYVEMTNEMVRFNNYRAGIVNTVLYPINGGAEDWFHGAAGLYGWLPEIGQSFWEPPSRILALAEENRHMFLRAIEYSGPFLLTQDIGLRDVGNGNGVFEPGEKIEVDVRLRNRGVVDATGVEVRLVSLTPFAAVEVGTVPAGTVASFTDWNSSTPLRAAIPAFTAPGTELRLELEVAFDGHTLRRELPVIIGQSATVVQDDCETRTWTTGAPGDTANDGQWAWGNPVRTAVGFGSTVQTGDDHTPGSGTRCYVTGNQNTSNPEADDVDGGTTTLLTPVYDLSGTRNPYIRYWRYYMDVGSEPNNDPFVVSVSNDGGQSWVVVETVMHSDPVWRAHRFRLRDFVDPTATVQLRFVARDAPNDSQCEALIDDLAILDFDDGVSLGVRGTLRAGQALGLDLTATRSADLSYLAAVALGSRPGIPLASGRTIPLNADPLLGAFLGAPTVFQNFFGQLDAQGQATARIVLPTRPSLVGLTMYAAFLTFDATAPEGIFDISGATPLTVVR